MNHVSSNIRLSLSATQGSMAEAVGLAASLVALAGLAHTGLKFVRETRRLVRGVKRLDKETNRSINHIYLAANTINVAQSTLARYCESGLASRSKVIRFIEDKEAVTVLESESEYLRDHVEEVKKAVYALPQRWVLMAAVIWHWVIKEQIDDLRDDMEFIQVTLQLLLFSVQLEKALEREERPEADMQVELFPREDLVID